jgi:prepilin-type N-terminal cleavage/methylation domain-containing protein
VIALLSRNGEVRMTRKTVIRYILKRLHRICRSTIQRVDNSTRRNHSSFRVSAGFTLVELIVVTTVIAILTGLVLSTVGYVQKKGARARAATEMAAMSAACENYKADNGIYPRTVTTDGLDPTTTYLADYKTPSRDMYGLISGDGNFDGTPDAGARSYMTFKPGSLLRDDMSNPPSASNLVTAIRDPFGNSYGYSTMKASGGANGYNPTFDLWTVADGTAGTDQIKWVKNW